MAVNKLGFGVALAACIGLAPMAALAQSGDCKPELVVPGEASISRTLGAFPSSLFAWKKAAKEKHGAAFDNWSRSVDRRIDCKQELTGKKLWVCTRSAKPCGPGGGTGAGGPDLVFKDPAAKLVRGDKGPEVEILQKLLNRHGAKPEIKVDGSYGSGTEAAVIEFQKKEGLTPDGRAGKLTKERLQS
jgi:hypothetical protein